MATWVKGATLCICGGCLVVTGWGIVDWESGD